MSVFAETSSQAGASGRPRTGLGASLQAAGLDRIDLAIMRTLERDGRISKSALAANVNLSASACTERMRALEKRKLILSYNARINVKVLSPIEIFLTEVTLKTHRYQDFVRFESWIANVPQVVECFAVGGGLDYILKIVAPNVDAYQILLETMLSAEIGIDRYFTYVCTKQIKTPSRVPIDAVLAPVADAEPG